MVEDNHAHQTQKFDYICEEETRDFTLWQNNIFNQYCKFSITGDSISYYIYLIYRPPTSGQVNSEHLYELFRGAERNSLFVGDFNLPYINWEEGTAAGKDEWFVQLLRDHNFEQLVSFPTHIKGNCLDLVLTNMPGKVGPISEVGRLGSSDHVMLQFDLMVSA